MKKTLLTTTILAATLAGSMASAFTFDVDASDNTGFTVDDAPTGLSVELPSTSPNIVPVHIDGETGAWLTDAYGKPTGNNIGTLNLDTATQECGLLATRAQQIKFDAVDQTSATQNGTARADFIVKHILHDTVNVKAEGVVTLDVDTWQGDIDFDGVPAVAKNGVAPDQDYDRTGSYVSSIGATAENFEYTIAGGKTFADITDKANIVKVNYTITCK
ncbi:MAG: hypothetical protein N0C84_00505 [Candidatus Thiodiazotropha taylori]|uniref:Uncharacterized protein n=1 Tax=Candidatus Thiodiazotropha taylori TaxID=2792791 RepID=A0A9E4KA42_9GAMM|nr:hypothetical protein [Candidatus Thiodiazotropha taylori]MCW4254925.1 hypothetical protein [Candidatus Thiodiazotropha taylori]